MMLNFFERSSQVLRNALEQGIIEPVLPPFDRIGDKLFKWVENNLSPYADSQPIREPFFDSNSLRFSVNTYHPYRQPENEYIIVELARVAIPYGSIGYLKRIDQFIKDIDNLFFPTQCDYWGNPYPDSEDLGYCRWYLRLSQFEGNQPERFIRHDTVALIPEMTLPGIPYYEMSEFRDIWFPPHASNQLPSLLIPGGYMLRYFCYAPPGETYRWVVAGRLQATMQSVMSDLTHKNTQRSW